MEYWVLQRDPNRTIWGIPNIFLFPMPIHYPFSHPLSLFLHLLNPSRRSPFSLPSILLSHLLLSFFSHETPICRRITKLQAKKELIMRYINGIRVTIDHSRSSNQQGEW